MERVYVKKGFLIGIKSYVSLSYISSGRQARYISGRESFNNFFVNMWHIVHDYTLCKGVK